MKLVKLALLSIILLVVAVSGLSCKKDTTSSGTTSTEVVTVQRGTLENPLTFTGNLAYTDKEELTFEAIPTGIVITVEEVLVKDGDMVKKDQVLARVDTSVWQDYLDTLQSNLTKAQRDLTIYERDLPKKIQSVETMENALIKAKRDVQTMELALRQAQLNLQKAQFALESVPAVKSAQNNVDILKEQLELAIARMNFAVITDDPEGQLQSLRLGIGLLNIDLNGYDDWTSGNKVHVKGAIDRLNDVLKAEDWDLATDTALQISTKTLDAEQKQKLVDDAQIDIDNTMSSIKTAQINLDSAKVDVQLAQIDGGTYKKSVSDAQKKLDDALAKKTELVAPFDGYMTVVNAEGGTEVNKGYVACAIADPNKFECPNIWVGETYISKIKLDDPATVSVDSLNGMTFPAKVTYIAPTATPQSGVVNFRVKVELESITPVQSGQQTTQQRSFTLPRLQTGSMPTGLPDGQQGGTLPAPSGAAGQAGERLRQAIESGQITQEQLDQMRERFQGAAAGQQPAPATPTQAASVQLREGLTVTVTITVDRKVNALMVPNRAITTEGGKSYVQAVLPDGKTEKREVTKGVSNTQYTEITQGLAEGDKVMITRSTSSTGSSSSSQQRPGGAQFFIPGVGGR